MKREEQDALTLAASEFARAEFRQLVARLPRGYTAMLIVVDAGHVEAGGFGVGSRANMPKEVAIKALRGIADTLESGEVEGALLPKVLQ